MKKIIQKIIILLVLLVLSLPGLVFSNTFNTSNAYSLIQTKYAWMWGYRDTQIPKYLEENFDHIFERLAKFFNVNIQDEKIMIWIVDFETLQELYIKENPKVVAAFYDSKFNRIYFTPRYINKRYITHELINYFFDEHRERVVPVLAEFLVWQELIKESIIKEFIIKNTEVKK